MNKYPKNIWCWLGQGSIQAFVHLRFSLRVDPYCGNIYKALVDAPLLHLLLQESQ